MSKTFDIKSILTGIKGEVASIAALDKATFESKVDHCTVIGSYFDELVRHEVGLTPTMTANTVYDKHAKVLSPMMNKTAMVNECHVFFLAGPTKLTSVVAKYKRVGLGPDKARNADGSVKLRMDFLAQAVRNDRDGTYGTDGSITAKSGNAKTPAKIRKEKEAVVSELAETWGEAFDLRFFVDDELAVLAAALNAEIARRKAGGKVLKAAAAA